MVLDGLQLSTGSTVEHGDILRAVILLAAAALQVLIGVVVAKEHIVALAVNGTGGCLHHELAKAVAIKVPCHEGGGVGRVEHVLAGVQHPQTGAVELVAAVECR